MAKLPQYFNWPQQADRLFRSLREDDDPTSDWAAIPKNVSEYQAVSKSTLLRGQELSAIYCAQCHVRPEPSDLPKISWANWFRNKYSKLAGWEVIPKAAHKSFAERNGKAAPDFTTRPPHLAGAIRNLRRTDFAVIASYYLHEAPVFPPAQTTNVVRSDVPAPFSLRQKDRNLKNVAALYGSGRIDPLRKKFILGSVDRRQLTVFDAAGVPVRHIALTGAPSDIRLEGGDLVVTLMGQGFAPHQSAEGSVVRVKNYAGWFAPRVTELFGALYRPVMTMPANFGGSGASDLIVPEFGFHIGRLSVFDATGKRKLTLLQMPGPLGVSAVDFDGDSHLDLLALVAQEQETLFYFRGTGQGTFEDATKLFQFAPSYGFNSIQLADLNGDGQADVVTTNGDNMDLEDAPLKNFHGVRVFRNIGGKVEPSFFFAMHGASGCVVRDFDSDGDKDIVAISFWPARGADRQSVTYLENVGSFQFREHAMPKSVQLTPWVGITAGDLDGDGDAELLLFTMLNSPTAPNWVMLDNQTRP